MKGIFRKSRQFLISRNKVRNYILYSIGEIILVVVGILIALSIDNWNEERKDRVKEQLILVQLRDEFQSNLIRLEEKISTRQNMIESSQRILKDIDDQNIANRDSLLSRLVLLVNDPTFDPIINDLIGSGNIRLIRHEQLKRLLTNWSSDVIALQEVEKRWTKLVNEMVVPFYVESGITRDALDQLYASNNSAPFALDKLSNKRPRLGKSNQHTSTSEILNSKNLEGIVSIAIGLNNSANIQSFALEKRINKIMSLLNEEIISGQ